jgi:C4-dicarboxylate-binding protein DctP
VVASTDWLKSLKPEVRDQFLKILNEVTVERNAAVKKVDQENRQKVADTGTVIRTLTDAQRQAWVDAMKPMWKKFEGDIGADLMEAALKAN